MKHFKASKGGFVVYRPQNIKVQGEAAHADDAANHFPKSWPISLRRVDIVLGKFLMRTRQGSFFKNKVFQNFIAKEEKSVPGFKAAKDKQTCCYVLRLLAISN